MGNHRCKVIFKIIAKNRPCIETANLTSQYRQSFRDIPYDRSLMQIRYFGCDIFLWWLKYVKAFIYLFICFLRFWFRLIVTQEHGIVLQWTNLSDKGPQTDYFIKRRADTTGLWNIEMHVLVKVICVQIACVWHYSYDEILQKNLRNGVVVLEVPYIGDLLWF